MAKRRSNKSSLARVTKRVATRKRNAPKAKPKRKRAAPRKNPESSIAIPNPPILEDLTTFILPGVGAYAGTRIVGRIAYRLARKKSTKAAKHLGALTPAAMFAALWFIVHKVKRLEEYHTPVVIGSAIAAIQALVQTYVPQYGWILNDYHLDDVLPSAKNGKNGANGESPEAQGQIEVDEGTIVSGELSPHDDFADIMKDGEGENDLYTGNFAGGLTS